MRIVVRANEFVWVGEDATECAKSLRAPESCIFEQFEIWRNGEPFDTGAILYIAEQGYDGFEGFDVLFGKHTCLRVLEPSQFQQGDEIRINLLRGNIPEADYWAGLTATASP
jgi:hypothetical protein